MADALVVGDPALAVEVVEYVVGVVSARQQSGSGLAISYFRKLIEELGVRCGVNDVVKVMRRLGLTTKVASHQFSTQQRKGLAAGYEVGPAVAERKV